MNHLNSDDITLYLDNGLDELTRAKIDNHLHSCDSCKEKITLASRLKTIFAQLPEPELSKDFTKQIMSTIPRKQPFKIDNLFSYRISTENIFQACSLAAAVILLTIVPNNSQQSSLDLDDLLLAEFSEEESTIILNEKVSNINFISLGIEEE